MCNVTEGVCCVHGASYRRVLSNTTNMAAAVRMRTWSCPKTGVFSPLAIILVVLLSAIDAVSATPEPGLWTISIVNVSIERESLECTAEVRHQAAKVSHISLVVLAHNQLFVSHIIIITANYSWLPDLSEVLMPDEQTVWFGRWSGYGLPLANWLASP